MTDPFLTAARKVLTDSFDVLGRAVDGLDGDTLNAKPAGDDTNSIAVLTTHAMHATRVLLSTAVGVAHPPRDRVAEFATAVPGPEPLLAMIEALAADCLAVLDGAGSVDWGATRTFTRANGTTVEFTGAYALVHALDHLRGHADEAALTRHVMQRR